MTDETPKCGAVDCETPPIQSCSVQIADAEHGAGSAEWVSYAFCEEHQPQVLAELLVHIARRVSGKDRVVRFVDYAHIPPEDDD